MVISVINKKGGVGKTCISSNIARDLDLNFLSNDDSVVPLLYKKAKTIKDLELQQNTVYDFGGFIDNGVVNILKNSQIIIIPMLYDNNSILKTSSLLKELGTFIHQDIEIMIVFNQIEKGTNDKEFREIESKLYGAFNSKFVNLMFYKIKKSKIWTTSLNDEKSVLEIKNSSKINRYRYRNSLLDYEDLLNNLK